jgi:lipopolysaccharide assembly protein A
MRYVKGIFGFMLVLLTILLIVGNRVALDHAVTLKFDIYFFKRESGPVPLWMMILLSFFLGALTSFVYLVYGYIKQRRTIRHLRQSLENMESELKRAGVVVEASAAKLKAAASAVHEEIPRESRELRQPREVNKEE